jgi:hypothetical protein
MNNHLRLCIFMLFLSLASSCRRQPVVSLQTKIKDETFKNVELHEVKFTYLSAKAKINYKDSDNDQNATVNIRIKKDSLIWISLVPALGIEVSRCLITKDSIYILDRLNNQYLKYDFTSLGNKININLNYDIVEAMILGNLPFSKTAEDSLSKTTAEDYYILSQKRDALVIENYIKTNTMKLEKLQFKERKSHKELQIVYNNFAPLNSFLFGYSSLINLTYPQKGQIQSTTITTQYNKVEISDKPLNFPFNVPLKYTRRQ